jgi:hypothetical protein
MCLGVSGPHFATTFRGLAAVRWFHIPISMFDEEAETVSWDPSLEMITQPTDLTDFLARGTEPEIGYDTVPTTILGFEDTDVLVIESRPPRDERATDRQYARPVTDGDWPPETRPPTTRRLRRAGMFKAITKI